MQKFRQFVARHGLQWTAKMPAQAWDEMREVDAVLDEDDRREALGLERLKGRAPLPRSPRAMMYGDS
jgi:hypothetical protein